MNYGDEIIAVLYEAGNDGLSVHKIAIHIHNAHNTLFSPIAFAEVRLKVQTWLLRNSRATDSPVIHWGKRGKYRINLASPHLRQKLLEFGESTFSQNSTDSKQNGTKSQASLYDELFGDSEL